MQPQRGMVLLMVLAVLTLLCLLGLMFVLMANMERATARAYLDMVRAKMIAQSGIHSAMVNTRTLLTEKGFDIKEKEMGYYGEDLNVDDAITAGLENYENQDNDNKLQVLECPLYRAARPSFMADISGPNGTPDGRIDKYDLINVQGKWVGVSGIMPGSYNNTRGAYYTLKVEDLSGKIFINGVEDPDEKEMLKRVLGNLTEELFPDKPNKKQIGQVIVEEAPYANQDEIGPKLEKRNIKLSESEFTRLKSCITTYAWRDKGVIKPVPLELRIGDELGVPPIPNSNIFTWRSIRPLSIGYPMATDYGGAKRLSGRAPININTAPEPVLVALLRGLAGLWLNEVAYFQPAGHYDILKIYYDQYASDAKKKGSLGLLGYTLEITQAQAREVAQAIMQNRNAEPDSTRPWRGTFRSWQQFGLFCDKVLWQNLDDKFDDEIFGLPLGTPFLTTQQADVLKANFNPNTNLPEFNPPAQRLFWVGKDNLWKVVPGMLGTSLLKPAHSFEFSFFPTGYFLITSMGRLLGPSSSGYADFRVMAEAEIQASVQLFNLYRETSQKDFLEDFWTKRSQITEIIKSHTDFGATYQYTTDDLTLQSYPEILEYDTYQPGFCRGQDLNQSLNLRNPYIQDAHYDGYITLATVENRDTNPAPNFRASYGAKSHWDSKDMLNAAQPPDLVCQPDTFGPRQNRLIAPDNLTSAERKSLRGFIPGKPGIGTLFPDGVYSERDGVPMYDYRPVNLDSFAVSMWIKPHFFPEAASKTRVFLTYQIFGTAVPPCWYIGEVWQSHSVFPFGIYGIVNNVEGMWNSSTGYDYAPKYDNASFLACGAGTHDYNYQWGGGIITPCLNHIGTLPGTTTTHNHPQREGEGFLTGANGAQCPSAFRAGKWLHLAWVHQTGLTDPLPANSLQYDVLWVNGIRCDGLLSDIIYHNNTNANYLNKYYSADNILRLGEKKTAPWLNSAPDATLDEVCIWEGLGSVDAAAPVLIDRVWKQGRYYRGNDGVFTSRAIDLCQQAKLPTGTPMTVFMMAWTQYVPEQRWTQEGYEQGHWWQLPDPSQYLTPPTCDIDLVDAQNKTVVIGRRLKPTEPPDPSGELIKDTYTGDNLVITGTIRYRVRFLPNVDPINDILIDPLIFDDITIIYYSVPKFLSWAYYR